MLMLKLVAATGIATAALGVAGLVAAPDASAQPMSCAVAYQLSRSYYATAQILYAYGQYEAAFFWAGKAYGVLESCG